jgi:O-antigen/teichoic acid export membrane protein
MVIEKKLISRLWRHFMSDSLYRNSIYLLINLGITALTGFAFVLVCTHFYSQKEYGYATALIGSLGLATSLSNIGMNRTIVRFLSKSKQKSQDLVTKILIVSLGAVVAGAFLSIFFKKFGIKDATLTTSIVFVITVLIVSIKGLFDNVFIATRAASGTLIENTIFNVIKVIFPLFVVTLGFMGIFSAQLVASLAAIMLSVFILSKKHHFNLTVKPTKKSMEGKWRFAFGSYTADLIGNLPLNVLPIIVVARLGPVDGALWFTTIQVINFLLTIISSINQALLAEISNDIKGMVVFIKKAALAMYGLMIPLSVIIFILAPNILKIFSKNYISAEHILRLMTIFTLIAVVNYISGSILIIYRKIFYLTFINVINALIVIIYCIAFATNLSGIATGWIFGEFANVILFVSGALYFYIKEKNKVSVNS